MILIDFVLPGPRPGRTRAAPGPHPGRTRAAGTILVLFWFCAARAAARAAAAKVGPAGGSQGK